MMVLSNQVIYLIKINLSRILGEKRISQKQLSKMTNIRPNTINAYYNDYVQRLNRSDMDKICQALNCSLNDLIEYVPDEE